MADQRQIDREFFEKMVSLTANHEWADFVKDLENEIYQHQANVLDSSQTWDQVVFTKGWCKALAYIISLRSRALTQLEQLDMAEEAEKPDADV